MRSWTATVTRRGGWVILDGLIVVACVLGGLILSAKFSNIAFDIKYSPLKFSIITIVHICALIATSAIQQKAFRQKQTLNDDMRSIGFGVLLATIGISILFVLFQTHYKPLWIAICDSAFPGLLIFLALTVSHAIERRIMSARAKSTTAIFVEVHPRWHDSLCEARTVLGSDWRMIIVSRSKKSVNHLEDRGLELWDEKQLGSWIEQISEKGHKTLLVFGHRQPRTPVNASLIEKAYGNLIPITNMIDFYEEILEKSPLFENDEQWYSSTGLPRHRPIELALKRLMDIAIGIPLLVIGLPIVAILAIIIRRESKGDAIFRQKRVGLGGKIFTCYKLRTMTVHEDDSDIWPNFEANKVTKSGERLRRTGLDELPQLINVLKGDMSFIGPRPARPKVTERHIERLPFYSVVKSVKPGISGWAQLHQGQDAGDDTMFEKTRYNLYYAKHFTIWLDILIYIRTFSQLINGKKRESIYMKVHPKNPNDER